MTNKKTYISAFFVIIIVIVVGIYISSFHRQAPTSTQDTSVHIPPASTFIASGVYRCDNDKFLSAAYYKGEEVGQPPIGTDYVEVSINGAASTTLAQTRSADGARYANSDESLVFWNKGDTAIIMRDNHMDLTFTNCVIR